ncbi:hypothetical protein [Qaidamihabitans albus]|uniref:hypothetical protein n=1 Tax=Qaidamihabitans albus TaxID=2795733 RepID=UPI0018F1B194|nr:hypothetical protein [Qaidamihabitans albus]
MLKHGLAQVLAALRERLVQDRLSLRSVIVVIDKDDRLAKPFSQQVRCSSQSAENFICEQIRDRVKNVTSCGFLRPLLVFGDHVCQYSTSTNCPGSAIHVRELAKSLRQRI